MKLNVKDRVKHRHANKVGTIVLAMASGRYKILWDHDWRTGRTFIHSKSELDLLSNERM